MATAVNEAQVKMLQSLRSGGHVLIRNGKHGYLVSTDWIKQMSDHLTSHGCRVPSPGAISNRKLFQTFAQSRSGRELALLERSQYAIASEDQWKQLVAWFDLRDERQTITITAFMFPYPFRRLSLTIDGIRIEIRDNFCGHGFCSTVMVVPKCLAIAQLEKNIRRVREVGDGVSCRMWQWSRLSQRYYQLLCYNRTLEDCLFTNNELVFLDILNERRGSPNVWSTQLLGQEQEALFTKPIRDTCGNIRKPIIPYRARLSSEEEHFGFKTPGICGLKNTASVCSVNACLQILASVEPLVKYFLEEGKIAVAVDSGKNEDHRNCKVIRRIAEFVRYKWHGHYLNSSIDELAEIVRQETFTYSMMNTVMGHCQWLLNFLIRAISRGLNVSPYRRTSDTLMSWTYDQACPIMNWIEIDNRSIGTELFLGMLGLRIHCLVCKRESTEFTESMCLYLNWSKIRTLQRILKEKFRDVIKQVRCNTCRQQTRTYFERGYTLLPQYLVIHINGHVTCPKPSPTFPLRGLRVRKFGGGTSEHDYELVAIIAAMNTQEVKYTNKDFDHAVAVVKTNGCWYHFNDDNVYKEDDIEKMCSVMWASTLLYKRSNA